MALEEYLFYFLPFCIAKGIPIFLIYRRYEISAAFGTTIILANILYCLVLPTLTFFADELVSLGLVGIALGILIVMLSFISVDIGVIVYFQKRIRRELEVSLVVRDYLAIIIGMIVAWGTIFQMNWLFFA